MSVHDLTGKQNVMSTEHRAATPNLNPMTRPLADSMKSSKTCIHLM